MDPSYNIHGRTSTQFSLNNTGLFAIEDQTIVITILVKSNDKLDNRVDNEQKTLKAIGCTEARNRERGDNDDILAIVSKRC